MWVYMQQNNKTLKQRLYSFGTPLCSPAMAHALFNAKQKQFKNIQPVTEYSFE